MSLARNFRTCIGLNTISYLTFINTANLGGMYHYLEGDYDPSSYGSLTMRSSFVKLIAINRDKGNSIFHFKREFRDKAVFLSKFDVSSVDYDRLWVCKYLS